METETEIEIPEPADAPEPAPDEPTPEPATALDAVNDALDAETSKPPEDNADGEDDEAPKPEAAKPAAAPAAAKPAEKESASTPAPQEPRVADAINDPIPADIRGKTRERMTALIGTVKEVSSERDRYLGERDEIVGMIQSTRATPEQYGQALDYLRAVNSGDPAQIRVAIKTAQEELRALASMIGEPVPGVDMLEGHTDLQVAVEAGNITAEMAQELAAARALRASQAHQGQRQTEQTQATQAINAGKAQLNQLEVQLQSDPLYQAKRAMLIPMLQPILTQLPPGEWARAFKQAYDRLQLPSVAAPAPRAAPQGQPLRARQPAGTAAKQPSSMLDAINDGIERASRR